MVFHGPEYCSNVPVEFARHLHSFPFLSGTFSHQSPALVPSMAFGISRVCLRVPSNPAFTAMSSTTLVFKRRIMQALLLFIFLAIPVCVGLLDAPKKECFLRRAHNRGESTRKLSFSSLVHNFSVHDADSDSNRVGQLCLHRRW